MLSTSTLNISYQRLHLKKSIAVRFVSVLWFRTFCTRPIRPVLIIYRFGLTTLEDATLGPFVLFFALFEAFGLTVKHATIGTAQQTLSIFVETVRVSFQNAFLWFL